MAPQTASRIAREVRDLVVAPETGVCLIVDEATGLPPSLQELTVRVSFATPWSSVLLPGLVGCVVEFISMFLCTKREIRKKSVRESTCVVHVF
jgi:hypothetical protein